MSDDDKKIIDMNAAELGCELVSILADNPMPDDEPWQDCFLALDPETRDAVAHAGAFAIHWVATRLGYTAQTDTSDVQ